MARGVQSVPEPNINPPALAPDAFDELMEGLPEEQRNIRLDRIAGEDPSVPVPPSFIEPPVGKVLVLNLRYPEEEVFVPSVVMTESGTRQDFNGDQSVQFFNGRALISEERAQFVKEVCPYVYIEPTEGPVLEFQQTGFKTRSVAALNEYSRRWADNQ